MYAKRQGAMAPHAPHNPVNDDRRDGASAVASAEGDQAWRVESRPLSGARERDGARSAARPAHAVAGLRASRCRGTWCVLPRLPAPGLMAFCRHSANPNPARRHVTSLGSGFSPCFCRFVPPKAREAGAGVRIRSLATERRQRGMWVSAPVHTSSPSFEPG